MTHYIVGNLEQAARIDLKTNDSVTVFNASTEDIAELRRQLNRKPIIAVVEKVAFGIVVFTAIVYFVVAPVLIDLLSHANQ